MKPQSDSRSQTKPLGMHRLDSAHWNCPDAHVLGAAKETNHQSIPEIEVGVSMQFDCILYFNTISIHVLFQHYSSIVAVKGAYVDMSVQNSPISLSFTMPLLPYHVPVATVLSRLNGNYGWRHTTLLLLSSFFLSEAFIFSQWEQHKRNNASKFVAYSDKPALQWSAKLGKRKFGVHSLHK